MSEPVADYRLTIDGQDFTPKLRPRLLVLTLTEKRGGEADQLDIELDDSDAKLALPKKGAAIALQLGWARGTGVTRGLVDKGRFVVDQVEWSGEPDRVRITARSADLTNAFRVRRESSYRDTTLGAIARQVAARQGLTPKVAADLDGIAVKVLAQHHQSDMALLRRLGREHDAVATVKKGTLILSPIGKGASPSGKPLAAVTIRRADGSGPTYREVDRSADAGVEARWHDQDAATRKTVKVGGGKGKPHRLPKVYHNEAEARAAATAESKRKLRGEAEFDFTLALGRPDLTPERPVTLGGFKPPIDARAWLLAELTHSLDGRGGLTTSVKLESRG